MSDDAVIREYGALLATRRKQAAAVSERTAKHVVDRAWREAFSRKELARVWGGKICTVCGRFKLLDQFHRMPSGIGGRAAECRPCKCALLARYFEAKKFVGPPRPRGRGNAKLRDVINGRMSTRVRHALRGKKAGTSWQSLVGYSIDQLLLHLERQLPAGASMQDFGRGLLHIDHIVPLVSFDVTSTEGLRAAWALSNLRPVWARDNLKKGAKRLFLL